MYEKLEIQYSKVTDVTEFEEHEGTLSNFVESVSKNVNARFADIWEGHHKFIQAGNPNGVIAAIFLLEFTANGTDMKDINRTITGYFSELFGESNVLSVRSIKKEENYKVQVTVYPLSGRILSTDDIEEKGGLSPDLAIDFAKYVQERLGIAFEALKEIQESAIKKEIKLNIYKNEIIPEYEEDDEELIYDAKGFNSQIQTSMPIAKIEDYINATLKYFTVGNERMLFKQAQQGDVTVKEFMEKVEEHLKHNYRFDENDTGIVLDRVYSAVFGNYILDDLLNDESISDIKVIAYNKIRVKVSGKRMTSNLHFIDEADYIRFISSLAIRNHLDLDENAIMPFTDTITNPNCIMRFNITTPYVNSSLSYYLHIRKVPKKKYKISDLIRYQMMPPEVANYLVHKAKEGRGIVFTGKGASGKTSLMNTLLDKIPYNSSGLVIQESDELFSLVHPDIMFQHIVNNGYRDYTLQDEARNGLLTDLDYFIIGEIKGAEALYFLNAADTGHKCWCSVHSPSSKEAINKLADYVMYESKYNKEDSLYMLKELETIVYMKNFKVHEISEVVGWDKESKNLIYHTVYSLN